MDVLSFWVCAALFVVGFVFWRIRRGGHFWITGIPTISLPRLNFAWVGRIPTAAMAYPKISTTIAFVILLYVLVLAFFPESRDFLLSGPGFGLLLLAIVGYSMFVIIKTVFWKDSRITALVMIVLLIAVLDLGFTRHIPPEHRGMLDRITSFFSGSKPSIATNVVVRSRCSNEVEKIVLTSIRTSLPDNCNFEYSVLSDTVVFTLADGSELSVGPRQKVARGLKYKAMRAENKTAEVQTVFCVSGTHWNGDHCS